MTEDCYYVPLAAAVSIFEGGVIIYVRLTIRRLSFDKYPVFANSPAHRVLNVQCSSTRIWWPDLNVSLSVEQLCAEPLPTAEEMLMITEQSGAVVVIIICRGVILQLSVAERYLLEFDRHPLFLYAPAQKVFNVELHGHTLYWPDLDVYLDLNVIRKEDVRLPDTEK